MSSNKYFVLSNAKQISKNLSTKDEITDSSLDPLFSTLKFLNFRDLNKGDASILAESLDFSVDRLEKGNHFKQQTSKIIEKLYNENDVFIKDFHAVAKNTDKHSFTHLLAEASMSYSIKNHDNSRKLSVPKMRPY